MTNFYCAGKLVLIVLSKILFRMNAYGKENFPHGGALVAANHASYLDPPLVGCLAPEELYYLARESLFKYRFPNWLYRKINGVPIKHDAADVSSIKIILELLKEGKKVVIFPEGTRTYNGQLQKARRGVGLLICKAKVPVIPTYIHGSFEALPRHRKIIHLPKVVVQYGKPVYFDKIWSGTPTKDDYQRIGDEIMSRIADLKKEVLAKL